LNWHPRDKPVWGRCPRRAALDRGSIAEALNELHATDDRKSALDIDQFQSQEVAQMLPRPVPSTDVTDPARAGGIENAQ